MTLRLVLTLTVALTVLLAPSAQARIVAGLGDQHWETFRNPLWQDLKIKKVRYFIPYDSAQDPVQLNEVDQYMAESRRAGVEVLVHFNSRRGCFVNGRYLKRVARCKAPSVSTYKTAVKTFANRFPYVKTYGAWNEANHISQPTFRRPKLAAQYYKALRQVCRRCKIVAGDLLDQGDVAKYARAIQRNVGRRAKLLWGLHNYSDSNRFRTKGTVKLLKAVKGEVWLTETGGITVFDGSNLRPNERKAARAMRHVFKIARRYHTKRRGYARITRIYAYDFGPTPTGSRFDASLLNPNGVARLTYKAFKTEARKAGR